MFDGSSMIGPTAASASLACADSSTPATRVNAAPARDLSSCRLVDEQEPRVELLGQGDCFGFGDVEKLAEL